MAKTTLAKEWLEDVKKSEYNAILRGNPFREGNVYQFTGFSDKIETKTNKKGESINYRFLSVINTETGVETDYSVKHFLHAWNVSEELSSDLEYNFDEVTTKQIDAIDVLIDAITNKKSFKVTFKQGYVSDYDYFLREGKRKLKLSEKCAKYIFVPEKKTK